MNTRFILRLLAVAVIVLPGARVLASLNSEADALSARNFMLNLMEKNLRDLAEREEIRAARQQAAGPSAASFDLNKDGKLDDAEFAAWTAALRKAAVKAPEAMKRFDKNHDGQLDDAEWAAALTELFGPR